MRSMSWPTLLTIAEVGWPEHLSSVNHTTHLYNFLWVIHFSMYCANINVNLGGFDHFWSQKCDYDTLFSNGAIGKSSQCDYTLTVQCRLNTGNWWDMSTFAWQYSSGSVFWYGMVLCFTHNLPLLLNLCSYIY